MSKVEVGLLSEAKWIVANPQQDGEVSKGASRMRHTGSDADPQLLEVRVNPGQEVMVHAHETGEILYIVKGQMNFGKSQLKPGDTVSIPGLALYSFSAGPEGVEFLNFRPRRDLTHFTREDVYAMKAMAGDERAAFVKANVDKTLAHYNMVD